MLNFPLEPINLSHEKVLAPLWEKLCLDHHLQYAEYSFANVFLSRRVHSYSFIASDPPFVCGNHGNLYLIPTIAPENLSKRVINELRECSLALYPIKHDWLATLNGVETFMCRANSDYLFTKSKLSTLKGRALSSRRNLIHQLLNQHQIEVIPLTATQLGDAHAVLELWQQQTTQSKEQNDYYACRDALRYLEHLSLFGRILYVDGKPKGFTIGELLTPTTAYVHYAKSDHQTKGVGVFLFQDFAGSVPDQVEWINLAQDLGLSSLRQAKEAFQPDLLLHKWRIIYG